jgi:Tol biopolymer transport system component/DNA-binding winged helix-turn-helix (wHTH) protein
VLETGVFKFEDFEARPGEWLLLKAGNPVPIEPKTFRVLVYLLRNPGRLVTKEELLGAVWDDSAVTENSLTRSIASLRRQLGDDAREPRFIVTVHTSGYRFVCPVEFSGGGPATSSPSSGHEASVQRLTGRQTGSKWLVASGSLVVVALVLIWAGERVAHRRNAGSGGVPHFRVVPVTNLPGAAGTPALSPDGKQVAFFWEPEGREVGEWAGFSQEKSGLYVQLVGGSDPLRLTNSKGGFVSHAAWSPDGREIAFGRCDDDGGAIYTVSALGGPEHKVTDVMCRFGNAGYANWTQDGKALVLVDRCGSEQTGAIVNFSLETGQKHCITAPPPGNVTDLAPVLSPDGQTVAFIRMRSATGVGDIYTVPLAGGEARRLTQENRELWQLMWSADGRSIIFLSNQTGIDGLRRIPAQGGPIQLEIEYPGVGSLSKDGSRLAYVQPQGFWASSASIWRADLAGVGRGVQRTYQIVSSHTFNSGPQVSPDGNFVVFESERTAAVEIWKCNADGSDPVQLTSFSGNAGTPRWSPDGRGIAFDYGPQKHSEIWVMDQDGRNAHAVVSGASDNVVPSWTRDGKAVLFASNRTGQYEVWVHDLETGRENRITTRGGFASFESPDGKSLLYTKFDGAGIWTVPRSGGSETQLTAAPHLGYWGSFAVVDEGIYFLDSDAPGGPTIEYYAFQTRAIDKVFTFAKDQSAIPWAANLGVSRDGRTIYFAQGTTKSSIVMAEFHP